MHINGMRSMPEFTSSVANLTVTQQVPQAKEKRWIEIDADSSDSQCDLDFLLDHMLREDEH